MGCNQILRGGSASVGPESMMKIEGAQATLEEKANSQQLAEGNVVCLYQLSADPTSNAGWRHVTKATICKKGIHVLVWPKLGPELGLCCRHRKRTTSWLRSSKGRSCGGSLAFFPGKNLNEHCVFIFAHVDAECKLFLTVDD